MIATTNSLKKNQRVIILKQSHSTKFKEERNNLKMKEREKIRDRGKCCHGRCRGRAWRA